MVQLHHDPPVQARHDMQSARIPSKVLLVKVSNQVHPIDLNVMTQIFNNDTIGCPGKPTPNSRPRWEQARRS